MTFTQIGRTGLYCEITQMLTTAKACPKQARWWVNGGSLVVCGEHKRELEKQQ